MSVIEAVIDMNAQLEAWLRRAGGQGTGVVSLARSLEPPLAPDAVRALSQFARVRHRVAHKAHRPTPGEMARVEEAFDVLEQHLSARLLAPTTPTEAPVAPSAPTPPLPFPPRQPTAQQEANRAWEEARRPAAWTPPDEAERQRRWKRHQKPAAPKPPPAPKHLKRERPEVIGGLSAQELPAHFTPAASKPTRRADPQTPVETGGCGCVLWTVLGLLALFLMLRFPVPSWLF